MSLNITLDQVQAISELEDIISPENAIIVTMINHCKEFPAILTILQSDHFEIKANRNIFDKMNELYLRNVNWNFQIICTSIDEVSKKWVYSIAFEEYNDLIPHEAFILANNIANNKSFNYKKQRLETFSKEMTADNTDNIANKVLKLFTENNQQNSKHINEIMPSFWNWLISPKEFISTQFERLNNANGGGWEKGAIHTIAARPGQGKTAMALSLINNDLKQKRKVGLISLEMSENNMIVRMISNDTKINNHKIKNYVENINDELRVKFSKSFDFLQNSNLWIYSKSSITAIQIYSQIKLWKLNYDIDIVYIDYLGLIDHDYSKGGARTYAIDDTMKIISTSAKDNNIPIILLCQIDRASDKKPNPTIFTLSDLSDSKSIEQFSHSVQFLVRPETYNSKETYDSKVYEYEGEHYSTKGLAILDIQKNRDGKLEKLLMYFNGGATLFEPYTKKYEFEEQPQKQNYDTGFVPHEESNF